MLFARAAAILCMAGYNSTLEALAAGRRPILVPRRSPRREQAIRAWRLSSLGLADVVDEGAAAGEVAWLLDRDRDLAPGELDRAGIALDGADNAAVVLVGAGAGTEPAVSSAPEPATEDRPGGRVRPGPGRTARDVAAAAPVPVAALADARRRDVLHRHDDGGQPRDTVAAQARHRPLRRTCGGGAVRTGRSDWLLLAALVALVLAIAAVDAASSYYSEYWLNRAGERIVHALRVATYAQLQRLSLAFHSRRQKGDLVTRVTGDVNAVGYLFAETLGTLASAVLMLAGMFVVCLVLDPVLTAAAFVLTPPLYLVIRYYQRAVKNAARKQRVKEGEIASLATEALAAMPVIKAFGTERFENDRVQRSSEERLRVGVEAVQLEARFGGLVDIIGSVSTSLILGLGIVSVAAGRITIGTLVVFVAYSGKLYKPLRDIARQSTRFARTMARLERIGEILHCDEVLEERGHYAGEGTHGYTGDRARGDIRLEGASFRYGSDRWALRDVDLHLPAGKTVAVVGASGAGKSTVAALVARFYDPSSGRMTFDGRDARECSLPWLREQVGVLLQETILFSGTVAENIAYGREVQPDADRRGGRGGQRRGVHRRAAPGLRHPARPRRHGAVRWPTATHRHRPRAVARPPGAGARRAHDRSGRGERARACWTASSR